MKYLWMLVLFAAFNVHANLLVEVGKSDFEIPPNHTWWQDVDSYSRVFNMEDLAIRVGYFRPVSKHFKVGASLFNLGSYSTVAVASDNEPCVFANGTASAFVCPGNTATFNTEGSIRGASITARYERRHWFAELGPIVVRQSFLLSTSFSATHSERLYGPGYVIGVGLNYNQFNLGVYVYESNIGGQFNNSDFPSGVGRVVTTMVGFNL